MKQGEKHLALSTSFVAYLGMFYVNWTVIETNLDFAIGKFLKLPDEETHILLAGMDFGRKAVLLLDLVRRSDDPKKAEIISCIKRLQKEPKRNILAHSFLNSGPDYATFVMRKRHGTYSCDLLTFTKDEFFDHVKSVISLATEFEAALQIEIDQLSAFNAAALSAANKPAKFPVPPKTSS